MSKKVVELPKRDAEWDSVKDDGCRWILDLPGGPFVLLPCDACEVPVVIESTADQKHHLVRCPQCGKRTPEVINRSLLDTLELWNVMVE